MRVRPKSLSSSRRFLCPVVVHVRLKSLSSSELSSTELAPSSIPNERATPQSGAPNSSQCEQQPVCQIRNGRRDRTCVRCARSCTMHLQTDIYIYIYIYKYRGISNRTRLLASLRSLRSRRSAIIDIYMSVCTCIAQDRAHLTQVLSRRPLCIWNAGCCSEQQFEESPFR